MSTVKNKLKQNKSNQRLGLKIEDKQVEKPTPYVFGKEHPPFSVKNIKEIVKEIRITRPRMRLVCMFNRAGKPELFTVNASKPYFKYMAGHYIIPQDDDPTEINSGLQLSFYHQSLSSPISLKIPVERLQQTLEEEDDIEVGKHKYSIQYALNPDLVKQFMMSQIIEKTMQGQDMQKIFDKITKLIIIGLCVTAVILIILLQYTGILNNIPFL